MQRAPSPYETLEPLMQLTSCPRSGPLKEDETPPAREEQTLTHGISYQRNNA
jgi:hypothetical protein